jgi:hypothetical protein
MNKSAIGTSYSGTPVACSTSVIDTSRAFVMIADSA